MTARVLAPALAVGALLAPSPAVSQDVNVAQSHVVLLRARESQRRGAGVIVGVAGSRIHIVTARHTITGGDPGVPDDPDCKGPVDVILHWDRLSAYEAVRIDCSKAAEIDLAVVEVDVGRDVTERELPTMAASGFLAERYEVRIIGHGDDAGWHTLVHQITRTEDEENKDAVQSVERTSGSAVAKLETVGAAAPVGGYSGGAVVDQEGALLGIVLQKNGNVGISLPWHKVRGILEKEFPGTPTNGLSDRTGPPNPAFAPSHSPVTAQADAIRSVLVQYIRALETRDAAAIVAVRPDVNRRDLSALMGDAASITLALSDCQSVQRNGPTSAQVTCVYGLTVTRRTGSDPSLAPQEATFYFERRGWTWVIVGLK